MTRGKQRLYTPIRGMTRGKQRLYTTIRGMIGKTKVEDTCLDPMHVEADEWEIVRGKHTKKLLSSKGNNVNVVELHAGTSARVTTRSEGRKHAIKAQGSGRGPPATPAK
jgi:3-dehydroquinate synthase class II